MNDEAEEAAAVERARAFMRETHFCDYGKHPHNECDCVCGVCFSFWHWNVFRYGDAEKLVQAYDRRRKEADD